MVHFPPWDNKVLDLIDMEVGAFPISCLFKNYEDRFIWLFSGVYNLVKMEERVNLGTIRGLWDKPWCL